MVDNQERRIPGSAGDPRGVVIDGTYAVELTDASYGMFLQYGRLPGPARNAGAAPIREQPRASAPGDVLIDSTGVTLSRSAFELYATPGPGLLRRAQDLLRNRPAKA